MKKNCYVVPNQRMVLVAMPGAVQYDCDEVAICPIVALQESIEEDELYLKPVILQDNRVILSLADKDQDAFYDPYQIIITDWPESEDETRLQGVIEDIKRGVESRKAWVKSREDLVKENQILENLNKLAAYQKGK